MIFSAVLHTTGILLMILGFAMMIPGAVGLYGNEAYDTPLILLSSVATLSCGVLLRLFFRPATVGQGTGIVTVVVGWIAVCFFGALPYILTGRCGGVCNAIFESVSGFTTTGASILGNVEVISDALLLWRAMTHWIGGMGIILLVTIILPSMEGTAMQLMQSEAGLLSQRFKPRLRDTGIILAKIYFLLTLVFVLFLLFGGMSLYDAVCHAFATVATGGFSTKNASIAHYNSLYIEIVITLFMFMGAVNYAIYFRLMNGDFRSVFRNTELRAFVLIIALATAICAVSLSVQSASSESAAADVIHAPSEVVCIITTTGFATTSTNNFDRWPDICKIVVVLLMLIGGCCGSTSGAIKVQRIVIASKMIACEIKRLLHPGRVLMIKMNGETVPDRMIRNAITLILVWIGLFLVVSCILVVLGESMSTSFSAAASTLGGVGPGFDKIASNYDTIPIAGKWVLIAAMLIGRLEVFAFILVLAPSAWKRPKASPPHARG